MYLSDVIDRVSVRPPCHRNNQPVILPIKVLEIGCPILPTSGREAPVPGVGICFRFPLGLGNLRQLIEVNALTSGLVLRALFLR